MSRIVVHDMKFSKTLKELYLKKEKKYDFQWHLPPRHLTDH